MSYDLPLMVYVIGPTNSGKTTLLNLCGQDERIVTVEVGKILRAKYPPSHFQGQNNPKHTANEAWAIYQEGLTQGIATPKCKMIVCDGQPRDVQQTIDVLNDKRFFKVFVHLWAPLEIREKRAEERDAGSPALLALSKARLAYDTPATYDVLARLLNAREKVWSYDTSITDYSPRKTLDSLLAFTYFHRRAQ